MVDVALRGHVTEPVIVANTTSYTYSFKLFCLTCVLIILNSIVINSNVIGFAKRGLIHYCIIQSMWQ